MSFQQKLTKFLFLYKLSNFWDGFPNLYGQTYVLARMVLPIFWTNFQKIRSTSIFVTSKFSRANFLVSDKLINLWDGLSWVASGWAALRHKLPEYLIGLPGFLFLPKKKIASGCC